MAKEYTNDELAQWFKEKALTSKTGSARNKLFDAETRHADINNEFVGGMYFFRYDPKFKAVLPMYDKYPLAIVVERYNDGFLGMNMHYLTKGRRRTMVSLFNSFYDTKKLYTGVTASKNLQSNWDLIKNSTSGLENFSQECVKRYLFKHVRSQFVRINKNEYDKAIQLPIDEWVYKR